MNTRQTPPPSVASANRRPPGFPRAKRRYLPGWGSWLVGGLVLFVLAGVALPTFNGGCIKGTQTKALAQAKQVGLALKLFAGDHEGQYPCAGLPAMLGATPQNSNAAFAALFPTYTRSESIFGNKESAYQTRTPDNVIDSPYTGKPVKTLETGENVLAYVTGLNDASDGNLPLVADGTDGTGHYTTDPTQRGGLWKGAKAIVIHLDNSGSVENLAGTMHARMIVRRDAATGAEDGNLLDVSRLGTDVRLLDPAVAPR